MASSTDGKSANAELNVTVKCLNDSALVNGVCPFGFSYPQANYVWATNTNVNIPAPNVIGSVVSYSISPNLPAWLSFNTVTGAISGNTPFAYSSDNYTVTAKSADFSTVTVSLGISVVPIVDKDGDGLIEITNVEQLYDVRWSISKSIAWRTSNSDSGITLGCPSGVCRGYELVNDLDFTGSRWASNCIGTCVAGGWEPIGSDATPFTASFEGNGYTIQNLYINRSIQYLGLFSNMSNNANISNIGLTNVVVSVPASSYFYVGGLAGSNLGTITSSYATGLVSVSGSNGKIGGLVGSNGGTISGNSYATGLVNASGMSSTGNSIGGLVGSSDGTISDSYSTSLVLVLLNDNANVNVGGLVGSQTGGNIRNNYATGWLSVSGGASGFNYAGGLVGYQNNYSNMSNNYATGWVTVSGGSTSTNNAGGLVGLQDFDTNISNSYAMGRVVVSGGPSSTNKVGGLVGVGHATIKNSYATGWVTASGGINSYVGGFLGDLHYDNVEMKSKTKFLDSYWDTNSSGRASTCGNNPGLCSGALRLTTAQMKATTGNFNTYPMNLGSCFQLTAGKYPKLYKWDTSLAKCITNNDNYLLGGDNATR